MIDEETVKHVAELARLNLTDEEVSTFSKQLDDVVNSFKILDELSVKSVEASFHPIKTVDVLRKDKVEECLKRDVVLNLAPKKEGDNIKAPRIV